jgi:hypothetical protein
MLVRDNNLSTFKKKCGKNLHQPLSAKQVEKLRQTLRLNFVIYIKIIYKIISYIDQ